MNHALTFLNQKKNKYIDKFMKGSGCVKYNRRQLISFVLVIVLVFSISLTSCGESKQDLPMTEAAETMIDGDVKAYESYAFDVMKTLAYEFSDDAIKFVKEKFENVLSCSPENFGNARSVRNYLDRAINNQANRLVNEANFKEDELMLIKLCDVEHEELC